VQYVTLINAQGQGVLETVYSSGDKMNIQELIAGSYFIEIINSDTNDN